MESAKFSYVRTKILNQVQDDVTELEVLGPRLIVNKTIPTQPSSPSVFIGDLTIQFLLNSTLQIHVILENTEYLSSILESAKLSYVRTKILNQVQDDVTEHYSKTTVVPERFYRGPNDSMPLE
ncbi:hypothetical protein BCT12_11545 [Vibrio breoganii]|nr:hypothetical protein BCT12_11545 [Vibrio breoganii]